MEKPWVVPVNWVWTEIKYIGAVVSGGTPSTKEPSFWGDEVNWISPADLTGYTCKNISKGAKSITRMGLDSSSAKLMPAGSVHFSSRAPIGYVAISTEPLSTNQGFKSLVPATGVFNDYLYYYFKASKQLAEERATGTTFKEISGTAFGKLPFPLAPINEQHRIVAKVEELFSELDKGIESLKTAREQLKLYRQAVLKHAFEGKLTAQWREANKSKLEAADQLLTRIKKEREARYQQQIEEWKVAVKHWAAVGSKGKKPPRISKPKLIPSSKGKDQENLPSLWRWTNFCSVTYKIGDIDHKMPKDSENGYPYVSTGNIQHDGTIDFSNAKIISESDYERLSLKIKPENGDIIFPRYGTIGRNILVNFNKKFLVSYSCAIIKNITSLMNEKYIYYFSLSPEVKKEIQRYVKETTQANVGIASIEKFVFPLCSYREQMKIVEILESYLSVLDQQEEQIKESLLKSETLRQSILKKAFTGQLVPQDPNDEPASVLLERIKAEKVRQQPRKKTVKRRRTATA